MSKKQNFSRFLFLAPLLVLLLCLLAPGQLRAEIDDSSLFMEAFSAFQGKDYLLSIDKINKMEQLYPDSPLRDVSLLMLSRAYYRAGYNDSAALKINQFYKEFNGSRLSESIEPELAAIGKRREAGEKIAPNKQLQAAALKIRNEQIAIARAAALKAEQERLALERAERERIAREKAEADRRERERLAAIKAARDAVQFDVAMQNIAPVLEAGTDVLVPFKLINHTKNTEEFELEAILPPGVDGTIIQSSSKDQPVRKIKLQSNQQVELMISFKMPSSRVDGSRMVTTVKATSTKFNDISKQRDITVIASAPLLRVVSRVQSKYPVAGSQDIYKVTMLNVGSRNAKEVDLRINLPKELKLIDAGGNGCWIENEQQAACRVDALQQGTLTERQLKVSVREDSAGKVAKGYVDVLQTVLQLKDSFAGVPFTVKKK